MQGHSAKPRDLDPGNDMSAYTHGSSHPPNSESPVTNMGPKPDAKPGHMPPGDSQHQHGDFDHNYMDSQWANSLLMDPNHELLYDMEFPPHIDGATPANNIVQTIQYQNHVSPDLSNEDHNTPPMSGSIPRPNSIPPNQNNPGDASNSAINIQPRPASSQPIQPAPSSSNGGPQSAAKTAKNSTNNNKTAPNPTPTRQTKGRRPCDHCRRRKSKCVLIPGTNNCVQCEAKSLQCTYVGQSIKRKPIAIPEEDESPSKKVKQEDGDKIVAPNVPIRDVQPVQDYSSMQNSLLKKTLSLQFPRSSFYVGPSSFIYDINLLNLIIEAQNKNHPQPPNNTGKIEQINLSDSISLRKVSEETQFILKDDQSPHSYQAMSNDVDTIEKFVAPHGQILIDLYFRIVHPSYPILHKKVFLEKYSRTHREFSAPLLAAVYVLAIQWWDYDPSLNRFPKPKVELILKIGLNNYLSEILKRPKLSAVQAGLLLLQCKHIVRVGKTQRENQDTNNVNNTSQTQTIDDLGYSDWVLCSQVISLAEELGLGLDCTDWKLPKWERGLRKRLAWAVFVEDKWLSLKNSRPSHIHSMNWIVTSLAEEDFPEKHGDGDLKEGSSDIDNGKKIFMYLIELSNLLSDILDSFYSMRAMNDLKDDITETLKLAKPIQLKLRNWYHSLPLELQMSSVQPRKLCSNGYLQLAYFATELTLHRKIITIIYNQSAAGKPPSAALINVCRSAAKTRLLAAIEFVRDLKPEHIHSFWHSSAASNFTLIGTFASILFASAQSKEESLFYRDQIFNYRWILKISSKGFDQVGDALQQLDLVLNHIPGLLNEGHDVPLVVPNVQDVPIQRPDSTQSAQRQMSTSSLSPFTSISSPNSNMYPSNSAQPQSAKRSKSQSSTTAPAPNQQSKNSNSPQSSQGLSPREMNRNRLNSFNNSSIDSNSPKTIKSKPSSPNINKSPLSNRNGDLS